MKETKISLLTSVIAILLCFTTLLGTTLAWFTDTASFSGNNVQAGNLDVGMFWSENNENWKDAEDDSVGPVFGYSKWEPGYTEVRYVKIANNGSLALKYQLHFAPEGEVGKLAEVIDVYVDVVTSNDGFVAPNANNGIGSLERVNSLGNVLTSASYFMQGALLPEGESAEGQYSGEIVICVAMHMRETAGNAYQNATVGSGFDIKLIATQYDYENDSFGNGYDINSKWPELYKTECTASAPLVLAPDGTLALSTSMSNEEGSISVVIPAGTKFENGVDTAVLNVNRLQDSEANVSVNEDEQTRSYDIHIEGIAADNTVPVQVYIQELLPVGLNVGNFSLYHVENGETVLMTALGSGEDPVHNSYSYDPSTGDVTLYMATFSEVALVAGEAVWNGNYDYSWYNHKSTMLTVSNADQLAAFGAIVGGMAKDKNGNYIVDAVLDGEKIHYDSFKGKTVRLGACIHIGDVSKNGSDPSENGIVFYPIGYYNNTGSYEKKPGNVGPNGAAVVSGYRTFEGTFDGYGHTVSDWYQNTWEMFGDYNTDYPGTPNHNRDGMGLFGRVYGGTVKNLTIDNFSSDGEFSTTGCVAAYADHGATFESIAIINSNPRVYNIGNGGVVGVVGWYNKGVTDVPVTFKNITVDNSNKITALWGSWDVACGGIVGTYYPTSGQSSAGYPANAGINFVNCHVGAQIDVYNDVCANYQYYAYRYSGMMIGSVAENETIDGHEYPKMDGLTFNNCTVHFGDWNDYYYCELVANSLASYTHDHQMSRLEQVLSVEGNVVTYLDGKTETVTGTRNFVVVNKKDENGKWAHADENAECYHFVNGEVWTHDMAGNEVVDGVEVLKEDKQHIYREFNNLVTGDGWGVTSMGIQDVEGVTILDRPQANSVTKFKGKIMYPISGREYKLSHLFDYIEDCGVRVIDGSVDVTITNLDEGGTIEAEFKRNSSNWADSIFILRGRGNVRITIQDYYYCTRTTIDVFLRSYPVGSEIHNYTYDGFVNAGSFTYNTNADRLENGKHGTYYEDLGFGYETFEYAIKMDSNNHVILKPQKSGTITIAFASANKGATLNIDEGTIGDDGFSKNKTIGTSVAHDAFELYVLYADVEAGKTYRIMRGSLESAIYYIGYLPTGVANGFTHGCSYVVTHTTATCEAGGTETTECLVCGKVGARSAVAYGHNIVIDTGKPATCEANGEKDGQHCTRCNTKTVAKESIPKLGHNYQWGTCRNCGGSNLKYNEQNYSVQINFQNNKSSEYADYGQDEYFVPHGAIDVNSNNKCLALYPYSTEAGSENMSYVEFTATADSTLVVVVSSTGAGNQSSFALMDANGEVIRSIKASNASGTTFIFELNKGTTYRFVCTETARQGRVYFMGVTKWRV